MENRLEQVVEGIEQFQLKMIEELVKGELLLMMLMLLMMMMLMMMRRRRRRLMMIW